MTVDPNAVTQDFPPHRRGRARRGPGRSLTYLVPALVAAAVAVALGAYGRVHDPAGTAFNLAGFSSTGAVKSWLATAAVFLAVVQIVSALMLYGRLPGPRWAPLLHRWSGRAAFLVSVPVAVHCLYALGYQTYDMRVFLHSALGCFFFGAFSAKMLLLRSERLPGWLVPVVGGLVFTVLAVVWLTSALWFFRTFGVTT
ncbi:hypothetical protein ADL00_12245 [Streptomyces sp. AS58]|uniref:Uncharacterized protein n=1 Tax=Streptomyces cadmiisoli TaxID=2184053 RepID=A0A2Z4J565_9ACTN|nr:MULTISPECIES: DUF6529 family protein [Streptomyces]AWW40345.1 hypothetical protein DN051_29775 [Streptomyces cadmiisoli]KOV68974.1 hypothetical protein ADL00_12245 [Streptomyces sp. AS58]